MLCLKKSLSILLLKYILGWDISENKYLEKGKNIIIYGQGSMYKHLIGYLLSLRYRIPSITLVEKELKDDMILGRLLKQTNLIFIDRKKHTNVIKYISDELSKRSDYILSISSDTGTHGSLDLINDNLTDLIVQDYYQIHKITGSNIHMALFDFENQVLVIKNINGTKKEINDSIILYKDKKEVDIEKSSIINIRRSILIYIPPICIFYILVRVLLTFTF